MKQLLIVSLSLLTIFGCGKGEQRYKGEYPTGYYSDNPKINVKLKTRVPFNGQTDFDLGWVSFGDLISNQDGSKIDPVEKEIGGTFLTRTASRNPGVLVEPQPKSDLYRIYFQSGSRLVVLTEPEGSGAHKFSSYPLGPMATPYELFIKGSAGCVDHISWDLEGKISRNSLLLQVDYHWTYAAPNLTKEEESIRCSSDLQSALTEGNFNPADPANSKVKNFYQIWYLVIRSQVPNVDPMEVYLQLASLDVSVQVAGVIKRDAPWK